MDISQLYAISIGGLIGTVIILCCVFSITKVFHIYGRLYFLKYVFYPQIPRYLRGNRRTTRFDFLLLLLFLLGNSLCLSVNVKSLTDFVKRSGIITTINLIPLSLGAHMNFIASYCGVTLDTYSGGHRWLGRITIIEGFIHVAVVMLHLKPNIHSWSNIAGLAASVTSIVILCSGLLRRRFYELYLNLHLTLAILFTAALYLHIPPRKISTSPNVYLLAAVCLPTFVIIMQLGLIIYRNIRYQKPLSRALIQRIKFKRRHGRHIPVSDAVHVHIRLSRPWKPKAGQYVYLCIPGVSYSSFTQLHPFYVSWWYHRPDGDYIVLIVQKRKGFTKNIFPYAIDESENIGWGDKADYLDQDAEYLHDKAEDLDHQAEYSGDKANNSFDNESSISAIIEGPYGNELHLDMYGTVLLFATDIGIAGQLPYVSQLLEGYHHFDVKTRRIALFWEVEAELHTAWVADRMQRILKQDTGRILDIHLFVRGNFISTKTRRGTYVQQSERLAITYDVMDARALIKAEIGDRKGRTVISLCVNNEISSEIREIVRSMMDETIYLKELDFPSACGRAQGRLGFLFRNDKRIDVEGQKDSDK